MKRSAETGGATMINDEEKFTDGTEEIFQARCRTIDTTKSPYERRM
jgi:hypothetical protein